MANVKPANAGVGKVVVVVGNVDSNCAAKGGGGMEVEGFMLGSSCWITRAVIGCRS